jgi:hypothetical protein
MKFNEDSRVKLPAILHLTQLGYKYISLREAVWDEDTNIFTDIFKSSIANIIPEKPTWQFLQDNAEQNNIKILVDDAFP